MTDDKTEVAEDDDGDDGDFDLPEGMANVTPDTLTKADYVDLPDGHPDVPA